MSDWVWKLHCPLCDSEHAIGKNVDDKDVQAAIKDLKYTDFGLQKISCICTECIESYYSIRFSSMLKKGK